MTPQANVLSLLEGVFGLIEGKRILDVGCGNGGLFRVLVDRGAEVVGVDPNEEALGAARRAVSKGVFAQAAAEALPFADDSFDGAVLLNSLHHVPVSDMNMALREVARVVEPSGPLVVVEPLAEGSLFNALRLAEDETAVRNAAQEAMDKAIESGLLEQTSAMEYVRHERYSGLQEFLDHIVAVDPARAATVEERRPAVEDAFSTYGRKLEDGGYVLDQPMLARILRATVQPGGEPG